MGEQDLSKIIARIEKLEKAVFESSRAKKEKEKTQPPSVRDIDFSLNERAFVKRYAASKSGPKKLVLLLVYLARGEVGKNIQLSEIRKHWDKMKTKQLLGKFNRFYPNEAKTRGFVDSKQYGFYSLTKEWKNVL